MAAGGTATSGIEEVVRHAVARVPFYQHHLAGADLSDLSALPSFDKRATAGWGRFPLSVGGPGDAYRVLATSGTSGDRLYVALGAQDWERAGAWRESVGRAAGLAPGDVLLNTHCYGLWVGGPALDQLALRAGACLVPLGPEDPARVLELLGDGIGTAISATPSYLRRLVEAADAAGFDLAACGLRAGFIGAEPAEQPLRDALSARLPPGFRWVELYGLTETAGPSVAHSPDPAEPDLELNAKDFLVEVLDLAADEPVPPAEVGELTITSRWADTRTPLVRYRTRDLARVTAGTPGAPARISRILGRADHSLKVGGVLVYPSSVAEIVSGLLPASAEWRAVVRRRDGDDELSIEAEATPASCDAIAGAFRQRLGLDVDVLSVTGSAELRRSRAKTQRILVDSSGPA